jgi:hypothetical protein
MFIQDVCTYGHGACTYERKEVRRDMGGEEERRRGYGFGKGDGRREEIRRGADDGNCTSPCVRKLGPRASAVCEHSAARGDSTRTHTATQRHTCASRRHGNRCHLLSVRGYMAACGSVREGGEREGID